MLLENLLQHEVSIESEMCHGLIQKLMDWCRVHNNFIYPHMMVKWKRTDS